MSWECDLICDLICVLKMFECVFCFALRPSWERNYLWTQTDDNTNTHWHFEACLRKVCVPETHAHILYIIIVHDNQHKASKAHLKIINGISHQHEGELVCGRCAIQLQGAAHRFFTAIIRKNVCHNLFSVLKLWLLPIYFHFPSALSSLQFHWRIVLLCLKGSSIT